LDAVVFGISLDSIKTQKKFKEKKQLPFELLSDAEKSISKAYGTLGLMGLAAKRKTFIVNPEGKIAHIFEKVNTKQHGDEVKAVLEELRKVPQIQST
jgi:peroxiredoxin Q/BCP